MSFKNTIHAELREDVGKGASRRLRKTGKIPAVIYGGERKARKLSLEHREILHATENESFFSSILKIKVADGREQDVVVRDMQRHPFKQQITHLDFMRVSATELLRISIPLHFVGEDESPAGRASGVVIQHLIKELEIDAMPKDLPEYLEVDLTALEPGEAVHLRDIKLPEGVTIPSLTDDEDSNDMIANAIHISEDQGTGAAAAAEAEALEAEEAGEEVEGDEEVSDDDESESADGDEEEKRD